MTNIDWDKVISQEQKREQEISNLRSQQKIEKQQKVDSIIVIVDGLNFQGDEISQGRLLRQADIMQEGSTTRWILEDNSIAQVTQHQLRLAAKLSVEEMNKIWLS